MVSVSKDCKDSKGRTTHEVEKEEMGSPLSASAVSSVRAVLTGSHRSHDRMSKWKWAMGNSSGRTHNERPRPEGAVGIKALH